MLYKQRKLSHLSQPLLFSWKMLSTRFNTGKLKFGGTHYIQKYIIGVIISYTKILSIKKLTKHITTTTIQKQVIDIHLGAYLVSESLFRYNFI